MVYTLDKQIISVFLIEDDPGDTFLVKEMISRLKFENCNRITVKFTSADRLSTAIEKILANPVDVILLDLALPDGIGKSSVLKLRHEGISAPIVVLTNRDDGQYAMDTVRCGAQDYLLKSEVNCKLLLRAICYAIERQKLVNELNEAIKRIDTLHGLLPICATCKKVRGNEHEWHQIERYVTEHTNVKFSHGFCPECGEEEMKKLHAFQKEVSCSQHGLPK